MNFTSCKPFQKRLERKLFGKRFYRKPPSSGVINRRNGCGTTVVAQRLRLTFTVR
ncbi:MAG TPA: hypothetical protein VGK06_02965 [Methanosarcina sp.]